MPTPLNTGDFGPPITNFADTDLVQTDNRVYDGDGFNLTLANIGLSVWTCNLMAVNTTTGWSVSTPGGVLIASIDSVAQTFAVTHADAGLTVNGATGRVDLLAGSAYLQVADGALDLSPASGSTYLTVTDAGVGNAIVDLRAQTSRLQLFEAGDAILSSANGSEFRLDEANDVAIMYGPTGGPGAQPFVSCSDSGVLAQAGGVATFQVNPTSLSMDAVPSVLRIRVDNTSAILQGALGCAVECINATQRVQIAADRMTYSFPAGVGAPIPFYTPANSADPAGNAGEITRDDDYLYKREAGGWKRSAIFTAF